MTTGQFNHQATQTQAMLEDIATDGLKAARELVERARDRLVTKLAAAPGDYDVWFYTRLQAEADRLLDDLRDPLTDRLFDSVGAAADAVDAAYQPAGQFGIEVGGVGWTRAQVDFVARADIAAKIGNLVEGGKSKVKDVLQQGMLGVMTPHEVQKAIARNLSDAEGFGPLWYRADMIWTTEVNGTANRAMIAKSKEIEARSPGKMVKRWLHSGNTRRPRAEHQRLGQLAAQPLDEMYSVHGIPAYGPHDAGLPAEEVIKCGCTLLLEFAEDRP